MFSKIVYAKKLTLPSQEAGVIQSLQMAAAFCELSAARREEAFFYPGLRTNKKSGPDSRANSSNSAAPGKQEKNGADSRPASVALLHEALDQLGIPQKSSHCWEPMGAAHRGLYGLRFRLKMLAHLVSSEPTLFYARDVSEAGFIAGALRKPFTKKRPANRFLFEMHEVLFDQHKKQPGKDAQQTRRLEQSIMDSIDGLVVINPLLAEAARDLFGYKGPVLVAPSGFNGNVFKPVKMFTGAHRWPDTKRTASAAGHSSGQVAGLNARQNSTAPAALSASGGAADEVRLVYMGGLKDGKGVCELVQAMGHLPSNFVLDVIGEGKPEMMAKIGNVCRDVPDYPRRVRFHGFVPQSELHAACSGAHISVIPQQREDGFFSPMKLNESLALGLPVVCTPLDIFSANKNLVHTAQDRTPKALAAAIKQLADNPEQAQGLRENGIKESERHTWLNRVGKIIEFASAI